MKTFVTAIVSVFILAGISAPAQATQGVAKKYSSCADLLEEYPNGVAKNKKARNKAVKGGFAKPKVSKSLYNTNGARLDRDKDGVMCEQTGTSSSSRGPLPDIADVMQKTWCEAERLRVGDLSKLSQACVLLLYGN